MDIIASLNKRQLNVVVALILLIAIPLTIYLVQRQQIFRGRATGSSIIFVGFSGTTPMTTNKNVPLKLTYGGSNSVTPPPPPAAPPPPPPPAAAPTLTAQPASVSLGGSLTVSWTGVSSNQAQSWTLFVNLSSPQGTLFDLPDGLHGSAYAYWTLPGCVPNGTTPSQTIPSSGSCTITMPTTFLPAGLVNVSAGSVGAFTIQKVAPSVVNQAPITQTVVISNAVRIQ